MTTAGTSRGLTDVGRVRKSNEDAFLCDDELGIWAVADGMGGHDAGEIASDMAVTRLHEALRAKRDVDSNGIRAIIHTLNQAIYQYGLEHNLPNGLGTTLSALITYGARSLIVAHVGDSRLYRLRAGQVQQLTVDHSWVQHQIDLGMLTEAEARKHPLRNVIMRSLGYDSEVYPDLTIVEWEPGDRYLLASDGLTNKITEAELPGLLAQQNPIPATLHTLIETASTRGGEDNITAVVIDFA